jgi:NTE family protein
MIDCKKIFFGIILFPLLLSYSQTKYTYTIEKAEKKLPFGLVQEVSSLKPRVTLALSGGGVRGLAQIGVLKALEVYDIPIDMIVGTSMGSIVGGLYSAGFTADELDSIVTSTNWDKINSSDRVTQRRELFIDQKITEDKSILALRLKGLTPILPTSIYSGQKVTNFLNLLTLQAPIHSRNSFDELKYGFAAVSTDLTTGKPVVLTGGSLSQAMRASSSISFFLAPVKNDSTMLVDGGLVANLPLEIAAGYKNDYLIGVNSTSPLHPYEELQSPWNVADQVISIPIKAIMKDQYGYANTIIVPDIGSKSLTDFTNIDSLIQTGYNSSLSYVNKIKNDLDSIFTSRLDKGKRYFKNLMLSSDADFIEKSFIANFLVKDSVSTSELLSPLHNLFNTGDFKDLFLEVYADSNATTLRLRYQLNPKVKGVKFNGISLFKIDEAKVSFEKLIDSPFNPENISLAFIDLLRMYRKAGYSLADIQNWFYDQNSGILTVDIDEGIISEIKIEGNKYTSRHIIERELPFSRGQIFQVKRIEQGLTNLNSTNLFDDILIDINKENNRNIIILKLTEKISSVMRVGFRVDNESKAQFNLDIRDENLFGRGIELGFNFLGGERSLAYILEHKSNRIMDTYLTYKINMFYQYSDAYVYEHSEKNKHELTRTNNGEYRQVYYGASLSLGTQVERLGTLMFKGTYETDEIKNKLANPNIVPYKSKLVTLKVISTIDTQDKYPFPDAGTYFSGTYETAQKILGGDVSYTNFSIDYKSYIPITKTQVLSPRLMFGIADNTLPLSQQFSLGGQNSFFGLYENEYRGRDIFLSSLEYRLKLPVDIFFKSYFKFRYDIGAIWDEQEKIKIRDLKHGVGVSLAFDTPVGPADFSVGRSFTLSKNLPGNPFMFNETTFYFRIGYYY